MYHGGPFLFVPERPNPHIFAMTGQTLAAVSWECFGTRFRFSGERPGPDAERFEVDRDRAQVPDI